MNADHLAQLQKTINSYIANFNDDNFFLSELDLGNVYTSLRPNDASLTSINHGLWSKWCSEASIYAEEKDPLNPGPPPAVRSSFSASRARADPARPAPSRRPPLSRSRLMRLPPRPMLLLRCRRAQRLEMRSAGSDWLQTGAPTLRSRLEAVVVTPYETISPSSTRAGFTASHATRLALPRILWTTKITPTSAR